MGYYTDYELTVEGGSLTEGMLSRLKKVSGYEFFDREADNAASLNGVKWYDHEKHMRQISAEYPDYLFTLYGEGEESGDIWQLYAKGGKIQLAPAVLAFEPFDEGKLA